MNTEDMKVLIFMLVWILVGVINSTVVSIRLIKNKSMSKIGIECISIMITMAGILGAGSYLGFCICSIGYKVAIKVCGRMK